MSAAWRPWPRALDVGRALAATLVLAAGRALAAGRVLAAGPILVAGLVLAAGGTAIEAQAQEVAGRRAEVAVREPDLPVIEHTLENGMRFLLLPRGGAGTVSFVVHVPVGSVNESLGTTGIAHFLEHLLFKGSTTIGTHDVEAERALFRRMDAAHDSLVRASGRLPEPDPTEVERLEARIRALEDSARTFVRSGEYADILTQAGARGLNATTSYEATEYFVELPANRAQLWFVLEADRMRHPVFREFYTERDVIAEERRARLESDPGGRLFEEHIGAAFRVHPYGVAPIGHMSDIMALSRDRVREYYARYYGPDNTIVAVVGDFETDSVKVWAEEYFGPLHRGEEPPPVLAREPEQVGERRIEVNEDAEPRLRIGWKTGSGYDPDSPALSMLANLLVSGRDSRLHRRLVRDDRIATSVTAGTEVGERYPGLFTIQAVPRHPNTPEEVEAAIYEELDALTGERPPTEEELEPVRRRLEAATVRRLTSDLGLAFQLARSESFWGDWRTTFSLQERMQAVQPEDIVRVVERDLRRERRTVAILRRGGEAAEGSSGSPQAASTPPAGTAASRPPDAAAPQATGGGLATTPVRTDSARPDTIRPVGRDAVLALDLPELALDPPEAAEHEVLGVPVYHLRDDTFPLVDILVQVRGGAGHFPREELAPLTGLTSFIRNGGTVDLPPDSVSRREDLLALQIGFSSGGGGALASLNALRSTLDEGLELFAEILTRPGFDREAVDVWRGQELERVRRRLDFPAGLAYEEFNRLVFGDHPVGWVIEEADLAPERFTQERLEALHRTLYCRDRLVVGIAGDLAWEEAQPRIERFLAAWPECDTDLNPAPVPEMRDDGDVYILPRDVEQTTIILAHPGGLRQEDTPAYFASRIANGILGASGFSSRLMRRVRGEQGLAYGASSVWTTPLRYEGLVGAVTATRPERTVEAVELVLEILHDFRSAPPTEEEVRLAIDQIVNGYAFAFRSPSQIVTRRMSQRIQDLPADWLERYLAEIQEVDPDDVHAVAERYIDPDRMMVLLVGDPSRFQPGLEELGALHLLSPDGTVRPWEGPPPPEGDGMGSPEGAPERGTTPLSGG